MQVLENTMILRRSMYKFISKHTLYDILCGFNTSTIYNQIQRYNHNAGELWIGQSCEFDGQRFRYSYPKHEAPTDGEYLVGHDFSIIKARIIYHKNVNMSMMINEKSNAKHDHDNDSDLGFALINGASIKKIDTKHEDFYYVALCRVHGSQRAYEGLCQSLLLQYHVSKLAL